MRDDAKQQANPGNSGSSSKCAHPCDLLLDSGAGSLTNSPIDRGLQRGLVITFALEIPS
jgi:hypothetical protein